MSSSRTVVCSAPGRAAIIGNPTDMYGGAVMSCSVGMRARTTITPCDTLTLVTGGCECRIAGRADLRPRDDWFDVPRAILEYLRLPELKCRIEYGSELPPGSGMSSSTAVMASLTLALLTWQGRRIDYYRLAELVRYVELNYLNIMGGYQDAYMCTFGGLNYMDFRGKQFYREEESELFATIEPLAPFVDRLPFVLGFTGIRHSSDAVHRPLRERWLDGEPEVVNGYKRIADLALVGKKALLTKDWATMGRAMNENHAIQRDLGGSGESNERLIAAALEAGAPGAKLAGSGDGGTIIALWPQEDIAPLERALAAAGASACYVPEIAPGAVVESDTSE